MSSVSQVRITGLRETVRALENFGISTDDLRDAFGQITGRVITRANQIVPVLSGDLQRTIRPARTKNKAAVRAGSAAAPYAGIIHWARQTLFLKKPADDDREQHIQDIENNLAALIRKYGLT